MAANGGAQAKAKIKNKAKTANEPAEAPETPRPLMSAGKRGREEARSIERTALKRARRTERGAGSKPVKLEAKLSGMATEAQAEKARREDKSDPLALLGKNVSVYWPKPYEAWFEGEVVEYKARKGEYKVIYTEDGVQTWELHKMGRVQFKLA